MTAEVTKSSVTTSQYNSHINYNMGGGGEGGGRVNKSDCIEMKHKINGP